MVVKKLGIFSFAKVSGILDALFGLVSGVIFSLMSLVVGSIGRGMGNESAMFGMMFGVGAIIFLPIFYGVIGFVFSALFAWLYNLIAGWVGGFEIELEDNRPAPTESYQAPTA